MNSGYRRRGVGRLKRGAQSERDVNRRIRIEVAFSSNIRLVRLRVRDLLVLYLFSSFISDGRIAHFTTSTVGEAGMSQLSSYCCGRPRFAQRDRLRVTGTRVPPLAEIRRSATFAKSTTVGGRGQWCVCASTGGRRGGCGAEPGRHTIAASPTPISSQCELSCGRLGETTFRMDMELEYCIAGPGL